MVVQRRVLGLVVAAGVAAAGTFAVPSPATAAAAAACRGATGVTVIVDYNEIGGPTRAGCAPDGGGRSGAQAFADAGFPLEYDTRQPGYVCKVTGVPTDRPCLENDSFWSLWWSDGRSGRWVFSNQGVGGLDVPDGGYVAFAWHEGAGHADPPDVVPTAHQQPSPSPSDDGDDNGDDGGNSGNGGDTGNDGGDGTTGAGSTTAAPTASAPTTTATTSRPLTESASPQRRKKRRESAEPTTSSSSSTVPGAAEITAGPPEGGDLATDTSDDDGGALTTWVGLGLAVLVLGAAGLVTLLRRRTG